MDSDLLVFHAQQQEPEGVDRAHFPARSFDQFVAAFHRDPAAVKRTIVVDGEVAGNVGMFHVHGEPHVGYWLGKAFWGRGVATDAVRAFVRDVVPQRPVYAVVWKGNAWSMRVLEKAGFTRRDVPTPEDEIAYQLE